MKRLTAILLALTVPATAMAWKHTRQMWVPSARPVQYTISDYVEDSVQEGYTVEAIQRGYAAWEDADCADIPTEFLGTTSENTPYLYDFHNHFSFDDPGDSLAAGVLAAALTLPPAGAGNVVEIIDGQAYYAALDSDIVFNDNVDWATDEEIASGVCNGEMSLQAVATHEIGHQLGMGHSCDEGEVCTNPQYLEATMFWNIGSCESAPSTINQDDIDGLVKLYGSSASFQCSNELNPGSAETIAMGIVPFDLRCVMRSKFDEEITGATWYWGDGETSTEVDPAHTYTEAGNYTVYVCFDGVNDVCGDWTYCTRREGYVRACDVPEVSFMVDHVDGRTFQFLNDTDISVYGCIYDVQWDVFSGPTLVDSIQAWEPEYTFEEDGDYRIVLNVGGPAGMAAQDLDLEVRNYRGEGYACNTLGGAAGAGGLLLALGLIGWRRRE